MGKANVRVIISNKDDTKEIEYILEGRLIGAVTNMQGNAIIYNEEIYKKVFTFATSALKDTIEVMEAIDNSFNAVNYKNYGKFVIALSSLKEKSSPINLEIFGKQLFVSSQISFIPSIGKNKKIATLETKDSEIIIIEEI